MCTRHLHCHVQKPVLMGLHTISNTLKKNSITLQPVCDPDLDATGVFLISINDRHNPKILNSRNWLCQVCFGEYYLCECSSIQRFYSSVLGKAQRWNIWVGHGH